MDVVSVVLFCIFVMCCFGYYCHYLLFEIKILKIRLDLSNGRNEILNKDLHYWKNRYLEAMDKQYDHLFEDGND